MQDLPLNMYHPAASKTSQRITCTDDLCESSEICQDKNDDCLYNVRYVSPNTWTSGVLVEDIIYLSSGRDLDGSVGTRIVFGCGQVQSGNFLSNGAPDGLLGLGMGTIAFPYRLAKAGLIKNSFSMCFASDGSGRIFFGDKGLASQKTTPFLPLNGTHLRYVVGLQSIVVGSSDIQQRTTIIIDSGTSFTYLPKDLYSAVTIEFDKQVTTNRVTLADVPWKFCYESSDGDMQTPPLSMVFIGGEIFPVYNPLIGIYNANGSIEAVCLAILESDIAIFGQSFMTGYQLVFDREEMQLGWAPTDCYRLHESVNGNATTPAAPPVTDAPNGSPSPAPKPPASEPRYSNSGAAGHCLLYGHMYRDSLLLYFCIWILLQFLIGM
ncbi:hypothetical protein KP509_32G039300 [Ceratopteris richardii]|uniref:Peptidase A1 domain-containing protein n=1 Tax=Ceratopteris richardii TaxID=49495 RepID=A0A8T2QUK3_CERRI|nr:hypothetical protein KP509_32G039300 [Ceratopteris richardii]